MPGRAPGEGDRATTPDDSEWRPSPFILTLLVFIALGYAAYLSPKHWTAAGLACITASALIATPELAEHVLLTATHRHARRAADWISKLFWVVTRFVYVFFGIAALVLIVAAAVGAISGKETIGAILILVGVVGALEFMRRQLKSVVRDLISGGEVDQRLEERHGQWKWTVAGALFLLGTCLQLIGTFAE
jgi:hypothetical protein